MKFALHIECSNAAFHDEDCDDSDTCVLMGGSCAAAAAREVRQRLSAVVQHLDDHDGTGGGTIRIRDTNGNTVGGAGWEGSDA